MTEPPATTGLAEGSVVGPVRVGPIAHGGHCVARLDGQVVFVRRAVPGELVTVRINEVRSRFARGEVAQVLEADPDRRTPPCPIAAECGGCDFQHLPAPASRELKRQVVAELVEHRTGFAFTGEVEAVDEDGFGWRTRMRYHRAPDGRLGLRTARSDRVVPLPAQGCRIADAAIAAPQPPPGDDQVLAVAAGSGAVVGERPSLPATVTERVGGTSFEVAADGFWQPHRLAPAVLTEAVLDALQPEPGERAFDLFCGVGLFAAALHRAGCRVWGVEGGRRAVELAGRNVPGVRFHAGDVARTLRRLPARAELVVLDPPRSGAGGSVIRQVAARRPRAIAYVACDPAALARDLATAAEAGYRIDRLRAFDLFGTTHHVECLAVLRPAG
ncbi:MAG: TRAM domain-containing protein [Propionicimonas sp.]